MKDLASSFESLLDRCEMNRNANDLIVDVRCVFANGKEDSCVCIVVGIDLLVFVDDYRWKKVKKRACLYAPHHEKDDEKTRKVC